MKYLLIVLLSIGLAAGAQYLRKNEHDAEKLVILPVVHYFMSYVLVSGLLFWINRFEMKRAVLLTLAVFLINFVWTFYKADRQSGKRIVKGRSEWIPLLAIFAAVVFSSGHFEFYGMDQDQGVYQTEAMFLYYGQPIKGVVVDEYDELADDEYKQYYKTFISKKAGYDLLKDSAFVPGINENKISSEVEGNWHGIPTYAAMLALSAKIFGLPHMQMLGTIFLICLLYMVEFVLSAFQVRQAIRALAILLLGVSPEIIWIKKSALTEGFLAVLIITFLYYMVAATHKERIQSCIPVVVFSCYHVTVFTMMPMFLCIYWLMYIRSKDNIYLKCAKIAVTGYLTGFFMMWSVQPKYTLLNYRNGLHFLSYQQLYIIFIIVIAASVAAYILTSILPGIKITDKACVVDQWIMRGVSYVCIAAIGWILVSAVIKQYDVSDYQMLTLVCYSVLSGFMILPYTLGKICSRKYEMDSNKLVLLLMFVWCILVYSVVMRRDIPYYYYYARYLMPYLSLIVIFFLSLEKNRYRQSVCLMAGCILLFPYANTLRTNQDDSRMEWEMVMEILENAKDASTVIIDTGSETIDLSLLLYYPLKAATDAKVYPVMNTVEETLEYIPEKNKSKCVYLTKEKKREDDTWTKLAYRNITEFQEDDLMHTSKWNRLVTAFTKQQMQVSMYKIYRKTELLESHMDEYFTSGWTTLNTAGYRWMLGNKAFVECYLKTDDYMMQIGAGDSIPFDQLSIDSIETEVYINQTFLTKIEFTKDSGTAQTVLIPKEYIRDGYNEIQFKSDTWSPAEYGSSDKSSYGFSVGSITFTPNDNAFLDSRTSGSFSEGWADVNDSGYRWMLGSTASADCFLEKQDYQMQVAAGDTIPFEKLGKEELVAEVYLNQQFVQKMKLTKDSGSEWQVKIPKELVKNGQNELVFKSGTWSPAEYGDSDSSIYGFSVSYIAFVPEGESHIYAKSTKAFLEGWSEINDNGFRWMNAGESVIRCRLGQEDYVMKLVTGDKVPFNQVSKDEIQVEIYVNGKYLGQVLYDKDEEADTKKIHIPKEYLKKGYNQVSFKSGLWSPAEYGSEDKNHYGISISRIEFSKEAES